MRPHLDRARPLGLLAAGLTAAAGLIEVVAGSNSWTGNKSEPTTLGVLTIVLAGLVATAALMTGRSRSSGSSLAIAAVIGVPALLSATTAGRFAIPGVVVGFVAAGFAVADASRRGELRRAISRAWPHALIAVLAVIYLAFGVVAGVIGILGIVGALAAIAALAVRRRSPGLAAVVLVVGITPFAVAAWWSVVIPLTAVLLLAIELPQLLGTRPGPDVPSWRAEAPETMTARVRDTERGSTR